MCVYLSCLPADQGRIEKCIWGGSWATDPTRNWWDFLFCVEPKQSTLLPSLPSFTFIFDPQPIRFLSHLSSHHAQSSSLPQHCYFFPFITHFHHHSSAFLTYQLSCCFSSLYSWFHLSFFPFFFFSPLIHSMFIKQNLHNLFITPPLSSPLSPSLGSGKAISVTCPPSWDLLFLLLVRVPNCIFFPHTFLYPVHPIHLYCQFKVGLYYSQREHRVALIYDIALQQSKATRRRLMWSVYHSSPVQGINWAWILYRTIILRPEFDCNGEQCLLAFKNI